MQLSGAGRRLVIVIVAAFVGTAAATVAPAAAVLDDPTTLVHNTSANNENPTKSVSVSCPGATQVYAVGARIIGNDGNTLLTRMHPSGDLRSAMVEAKRRASSSAPFAVTVYAVCRVSSSVPIRVMATVEYSSTVSVRCPGRRTLLGLGFAQDRPVDHWRIDALVPDPELKEVHLHASGSGSTGPLTVFGICHDVASPTPADAPTRAEAVSQANGVWPTEVSFASTDKTTYGVGASVTGLGQVHLDAFLPYPLGGARAARADSAATAGAGLRSGRLAAVADDGTGTLTGLAVESGTFH